MGGSLTTQVKALSQAELMARLAGTVEDSKANTSGYMNFDGREGKFLMLNGTDEPDEFPKGSKVLLNLFESKKGYTCWKDGKAIDRVEFSLFERLPSEAELTDHGPYSTDPKAREGWKPQFVAFLKDVESGKQFQLNLTSASSTRSFGSLINDILAEAAMHSLVDETPVVTLDSERFVAQGYKNYKPVFKIDSWLANPKQVEAAAPAAAIESKPEAKEAISGTRKKG